MFFISYCFVISPPASEQMFKHHLTEDFCCNQAVNKDVADTKALTHIPSIFWHHGKTLGDYHLPRENMDLPVEQLPPPEDAQKIADEMEQQPNLQQCQATHAVIAPVQSEQNNTPSEPQLFYVGGPGGFLWPKWLSGKLFCAGTCTTV